MQLHHFNAEKNEDGTFGVEGCISSDHPQPLFPAGTPIDCAAMAIVDEAGSIRFLLKLTPVAPPPALEIEEEEAEDKPKRKRK